MIKAVMITNNTRDSRFCVLAFIPNYYPANSVLNTTKMDIIGEYPTLEKAQEDHPDAKQFKCMIEIMQEYNQRRKTMQDEEHYFEIWVEEDGTAIVKKFTPDGYPDHSVLAGQVKIQFVDRYDTVELAQKDFPGANFGGKYTSAQNTFDHLPDTGDIY